ncbi:hypothetical protein GEMRC1_002971 [Eukaryota sp. GEM-RC1]
MSPLTDLFQKENLSSYYEDVLTLLLELRPQNPELFLLDYFKSATTETSSTQRAVRYILLITDNQNETQINDNCISAYQTLSEFLLGEIFNSFLSILFESLPSPVSSRALSVLSADPFTIISFERFKSTIVIYLSLRQFFDYAKLLFQIIQADSISHDEVLGSLVMWIRELFVSDNSEDAVDLLKSKLEKLFKSRVDKEGGVTLNEWIIDLSAAIFGNN